MDGPAFHMARKGMGELKKKNYSVVQIYGGGVQAAYLNESLNLSMALMEGWKKNSLMILNSLLIRRGVEEIAQELEITVRAVYKNIRTNRLLEYRDTLWSAGDVLDRLMKQSG
ncbi:MAG: hypothetical protein PQJ60_04260, partial [Spirochaetales bacterium]|nr:hypothetical protein [Spirochaetales bacterium]